MNKVIEAFNRALDWLEANPDKHITRDLAQNKHGRIVWPTRKTADCFCALGRFAKEMDLPCRGPRDSANYEIIYDTLAPLGISGSSVFTINDRGRGKGNVTGLRKLLSSNG